MGKLSLGLGFGVGYVLGARAGRDRFQEIKQAAAGLMERPEVQEALGKARTSVPASLQQGIDKLTGGASRGQGTGSGAADTEAPVTRDDPLPDPLIPPAKSC
jgi:hypothetical protein